MKRFGIYFPLALMFLSLLFAGCATISVAPPAQLWTETLPAESDIVIKARAEAILPLMGDLVAKFGLDEKEAGNILGRTREVYVSVLQSAGNTPDFSLILTGDFPQAASALFTPAKGFLIQRYSGDRAAAVSPEGGRAVNEKPAAKQAKISYWVHESTGVQLALPPPRPGTKTSSGRSLFVSQGHIEEMLGAYLNPGSRTTGAFKDIPVEAAKEFDVSDLVLYMPYPGKSLLNGMDLTQFPIRNLWITLEEFPGEGDIRYVLSGVFSLDSGDRAKKFVPLLKILILGLMKKAGVDAMASLKNDTSFSVEGDSVRLTGLKLKGSDLQMFMTSLQGP